MHSEEESLGGSYEEIIPSLPLPSGEWVGVVGGHVGGIHDAIARMEVELDALRGRGEVATEESLEIFDVTEAFSRHATSLEAFEDLQPLVGGWVAIARAHLSMEEEEEWNRLASRFLQIGIPRRHLALAGAVVRSSPTVDARKTYRQMREGQVVVVEEVAGNWARISSPVKGWVWRTHLRAHPDGPGTLDQPPSPTVTPGSLTSMTTDFTPGPCSEMGVLLHDTASDVLDYTTGPNDGDSLVCTRAGETQHFSLGTTYSRCTQSDTDYRSCNSTTFTSDALACSSAKGFKEGDRVRMRDSPDQYWAWGEVCRVMGPRVLVRREGFAGMSVWKQLYRAESPAPAKDPVRLVAIERNEPGETLGLDLNHQTLEVKGVDEDSPALLAGMQLGMRLVSVEGMPVSSMRDIRTLLRTAGGQVTLGIAGDSVSKVVSTPRTASIRIPESEGSGEAESMSLTSSGGTSVTPSVLRGGTLRGAQMLHLRPSPTASTTTYTRVDGYAALASPAPPRATLLLLISARASALKAPLNNFEVFQSLAGFIE